MYKMNKQDLHIIVRPRLFSPSSDEFILPFESFEFETVFVSSTCILHYLENGVSVHVSICINKTVGEALFTNFKLPYLEIVEELEKECERLLESSTESDFKKLTKKLFPSQPIPIKEVEKALGIELYEWQQEFMLNQTMMDIRKASGKTFLIVLMYTLGLVNDLNYDYIREKTSLYGKKSYTDYVKQLNNEFIEKLKHTNLVLHRIN